MERLRKRAVAQTLTAVVLGLLAPPPWDILAAMAVGFNAWAGIVAMMEE